MKSLVFHLSAAMFVAAAPLQAASLLLNFHTTHASDPGVVAGPYLALSPAHAVGSISSGETTWNNFSSTGSDSSLSYGDGSAATGVSVTFGSESPAGGGEIDYASATINTSALYGSGGGVANMLNLLTDPGSIYGDGNQPGNSAAARSGWLGGATNTAIGLRVDGLTVGSYLVYAMARNTNSNALEVPMSIHVASGAVSNAYDFSSDTGSVVTNPGFVVPATGVFNGFLEGENYVAYNVTIAAGESLYLAADGSGSETRGFLNMVQIVAVPEPSSLLLGSVGLLALFRRRR